MSDNLIQTNPWVPGVVVAVVLFIIGTSITLYLRKRDRESRTFDHRVIADFPLFRERDRPNDLKVTYKNVDVSEPRLTQIKFKNTGKKEIDKDDFEDDYAIFRDDAELLDCSVIQSSTEVTELASITEFGVGDPSFVKFRPKTLNRGDWFTIQLIYDGGSTATPPKVTGRFRGQDRDSSIFLSAYELSGPSSLRLTGWLLAVFIAAFGFLSMFSSETPTQYHFGVTLICVALGIILLTNLLAFINSWLLKGSVEDGVQYPNPIERKRIVPDERQGN